MAKVYWVYQGDKRYKKLLSQTRSRRQALTKAAERSHKHSERVLIEIHECPKGKMCERIGSMFVTVSK